LDTSIKCENCNHEINIGEAIWKKTSKQLHGKYQVHFKDREDAILKKEKELELKANDSKQLEENHQRLMEEEVSKTIKSMMPGLIKEAESKAQSIFKPELEKASQTQEELITLKRNQLRQEQEDKTKESQFELRLEKALAEKQLQNDKEREIEKKEFEVKINQMKDSLQNVNRQMNQSPSQIQGSAAELSVKNELSALYPLDTVTQTKNGADVLQEISTDGMNKCGKIYFEIKNTQNFDKKWIPKLKSDMREVKASIGIIVSKALLPGMSKPEKRDGIWLCSFKDYQHIAKIHRDNLIEANRLVQANENSVSGSMLTYNFVNSDDYERLVETMYDGLSQTHEEIESEKKFFNRVWAKRIATSELILKSLSTIDGTFKAYSNNSKSEVKSIEVEEIEINE
jgi:hypothetical protein